MLQRPNNLLPLFILLFRSCWILNGVVSHPKTNLLRTGCRPLRMFVVSNFTIFNENLNPTLRDVREQIIGDQNKHFATAQQGDGGNPVSTLFQCRSYLSVSDCVSCFDATSIQVRNSCSADVHSAHVVYDGCFLMYN